MKDKNGSELKMGDMVKFTEGEGHELRGRIMSRPAPDAETANVEVAGQIRPVTAKDCELVKPPAGPSRVDSERRTR